MKSCIDAAQTICSSLFSSGVVRDWASLDHANRVAVHTKDLALKVKKSKKLLAAKTAAQV